jgi:hypothetical protein
LRKLKQDFEQRKRNLCCKMATPIPYAYLRRKTLGRGARKMVKGLEAAARMIGAGWTAIWRWRAQCRRGGRGAQAIRFHVRSEKPEEIDPRVECDRAASRALPDHVESRDRIGIAQNQRVGACPNRTSRATFSGHGLSAPKGAETAAMSFWASLASGQITIAKIDGWRNLAERPFDQIIDLGP